MTPTPSIQVNLLLWLHRGGQIHSIALLRDLLQSQLGCKVRTIITSRQNPAEAFRADVNLFSSEVHPADPATKWVIDWGDGSGSTHGSHFGEEITGNPSQFKHVYAAAGTYSLVATVFNKDQDGYTVSELNMVVNPLEYMVAIDDNGGIMNENEGTLDFTLRRTLPADTVETDPYSIYVHVKTSGIDDEYDNSAGNDDYSVVMNDNIEDEGDGFYKITFDPNQDTATLGVLGTDDSDVEAQEWFKVVITSVDASGHTPTVDTLHSQAFGGIDDDEQLVTIMADDGLASEDGNTARFVVTRGPDSTSELDVPITFTGAAVLGTDYTIDLSGGSSPYVHFDEDETQVTFSVTAIDDSTAEDPEDIVATLGTPGGDDLYTVDRWSDSATAMITDEALEAPPSPTNLVAVPLSRDTVRLVWDQPGGDGYPDGFVIQVSTDDGETFTPYDQVFDPTARTLDVSGLDPETDYTFRVDAGIDDLDGNMLDDDEDDIVTEGDSTEEATTTNDQWVDLGEITPEDIHSSSSVTYFNDGEDLPAGTYRFLYVSGAINYDFEEMNGPQWIADEYFVVSEDAPGSPTLQPYEGLTYRSTPEEAAHDALSLVWPVYHAGGTLGMSFYLDDYWLTGPGVTWELQRLPMMTITADDDLASEDGDTAQFTVSREGDATDEADVPVTFTGDATFGDDYTTYLDGGSSPFVHFDAGESQKTFSLTPIADEDGEDAEDVIATISPPTGYGTGDPASATATITDLPIVWITVADDSMMEPDAVDPGTFTIHRSSGIGSLDVNYVLGGTADLGDDYTIDGDPEEQTVSMEEGVTSVDVTLDACEDNVVEDTETAEPSLDTPQSNCTTSSVLGSTAQSLLPMLATLLLYDANKPVANDVDLDLQGTPDPTEDSTGGYIGINADDDNGSPVTNHIPEGYDFETDGTQYDTDSENDLLKLTLSLPAAGNMGAVYLSWTNGAHAKVKVWEEMSKLSEVNNGTTFTLSGSPDVLYVEGIDVSNTLVDKVTFILVSQATEEFDTVVATVTPVLTSLSATADKGLYIYGNVASSGGVTYTIMAPPDIKLLASAFTEGTESGGKLEVIQNDKRWNNLNGFGAEQNSDTANPVKYKLNAKQFNGVNYAGKALLDTATPSATERTNGTWMPFYRPDKHSGWSSAAQPNPNGTQSNGTATWKSHDQPRITVYVPAQNGQGATQLIYPDPGHLTKIDTSLLFWLYAAWVYPTDQNGNQIIYFLGNTTWNVTWAAQFGQAQLPSWSDNNGVTNSSAFTVSNVRPEALALPTANQVGSSWQ